MELSNNPNRDIKYAIEFLSGQTGLKKSTFVTANVDDNSKGTSHRTVDVSIVLGDSNGKITNVNLQSEPNDGFILIPKNDTQVIVCIMPDNSAYVFKCNDIDKIICVIDSSNSYVFDTNGFVWNGGNNGGLIKIDNLKTQYDANIAAIKNSVVAALAIIDTQLMALGQAGGSVTAFNGVASTIQNLNKTPLENTKISH